MGMARGTHAFRSRQVVDLAVQPAESQVLVSPYSQLKWDGHLISSAQRAEVRHDGQSKCWLLNLP